MAENFIVVMAILLKEPVDEVFEWSVAADSLNPTFLCVGTSIVQKRSHLNAWKQVLFCSTLRLEFKEWEKTSIPAGW